MTVPTSKDSDRLMERRVGEVVVSTSTSFLAQCYQLEGAPALGGLVRTDSPEIYGVVGTVTTEPLDSARPVLARGEDADSEEDVIRDNPQLARLLTSRFEVYIAGHVQDGVTRQYLPPRPPRVHSFVYDCSPEEIKEFINKIKDTNGKPIVGRRVKRSESLLFQICYKLHKLITITFTGKSIKFGNFTCLPRTTVEKMINEKATWNSFSGALTKVENDLISIPSNRGKRYFGPSKMNFYNLIKHSLSIVSVFRKTFLIRSALFIVLYILLIKSNASIITAIPLVFLLIAVYSISNLALRENIEEFNKSLENITHIDTLK